MLLLITSAILLILAFPNFNLSYLAFIGFVPLFFALQNKTPLKAFLISYICGFLFYLGTLYWLYHVSVIGLIVLCLYLALYFGIFGYLFSRFTIHDSRFTIFVAPLLWALLEYAQSNLFTGFGWTSLGYSQYENLPIIQIADFSSVYGVSFVIMLVNVTVWKLISLVAEVRGQKSEVRSQRSEVRGQKKLSSVLCPLSSVALILFFVYGYGFFRLQEERQAVDSIKVSVIQGNIPQEKKWDSGETEYILERYTRLTKMAALDEPDLIVWPETSFPGFLISDRGMTARILALAKETRTPLLLGANTEKGLKSFNSAVLISGQGEILDKYDKIHLVPFGEYVPFSDRFPFLRTMVFGELGEFTAGKDFKVFDLGPKFAALICFEDVFPELARRFVKNGAELLIVITNDAWYGKSGASYQHAACSVFRAIENRVPVIRCANTGYSCFIDSMGRIYDSVEKLGTHLFITAHKTSNIRLQ
ncbi:MAG: apolipoprotein N-acyltransferase [Candidatus Omnitrophica bacterium]|nr:apolipoprotein N-acyltransferase [Candidatus Omnitrophota bacterium]